MVIFIILNLWSIFVPFLKRTKKRLSLTFANHHGLEFLDPLEAEFPDHCYRVTLHSLHGHLNPKCPTETYLCLCSYLSPIIVLLYYMHITQTSGIVC